MEGNSILLLVQLACRCMSYDLVLLSTEQSTAKLKVMHRVPPNNTLAIAGMYRLKLPQTIG